jgi:hypothetical protein
LEAIGGSNPAINGRANQYKEKPRHTPRAMMTGLIILRKKKLVRPTLDFSAGLRQN